MRHLNLRLLLVMLLACGSLAVAQSRDEQAIRALLDRTFQAGNTVDVKLTQQVLADHSGSAGPFFPPFTASLPSVSELTPSMTESLAHLSARSFSTTSPVNVRVDKNLAWATFTWRVDLTFKDGARRGFDGRTTATFVREGKNWKYAHWHNSLPASLPLTAKALEAESQAVLQVERSAWEAAKNKQTDALADYLADDASMFSDAQAYRVRGKSELMRDMQAWIDSTELRSYQMLDPQVQVMGDTALLTYYFTYSGVSGGKDVSRAGKITMVFVKQGGKWRALHWHVSATR